MGLFAGKFLGIFGGTYLAARFTRARLNPDLGWADMAALAMLAGIGFTVSLLIGDLAFGAASERDEHVKVAVLGGSITASALAAVLLRTRNRTYRRLEAEERADVNRDGVPDVFEDPETT